MSPLLWWQWALPAQGDSLQGWRCNGILPLSGAAHGWEDRALGCTACTPQRAWCRAPLPAPSHPCACSLGTIMDYNSRAACARLPAATAARETAPASSRPGTTAKPTLVPLPSVMLGWKLQMLEGFPGREASPQQGWDLRQACNVNSWPATHLPCHVQCFVFLLLISNTDEGWLISTRFMQNKDTELAKHWAASRAHSTSRKTISHSLFACPTPCLPKALPILLGKPFQHLSEPGQGSSASSYPGTELSYA